MLIRTLVKIMTDEIQSSQEDTKHDFKIYTVLNLQLMFLKLLNSYSPGLSIKSNWQLLFHALFNISYSKPAIHQVLTRVNYYCIKNPC